MTRPLVLLSLGAASFGALLGCWIALSASPVVMTVLPLLFTFAGGAGGVFVWRNDPNNPATQRKIELFGAAGAAFSLFCLSATLLTLYERATIAAWIAAKRDVVDVAGYADPLGALIYRDKLMLAGASKEDIKAMLGKGNFPDGWKTNSELLDKFIAMTTSAASGDGAEKPRAPNGPAKPTLWQMGQPNVPEPVWPLALERSPQPFDWMTKKIEGK